MDCEEGGICLEVHEYNQADFDVCVRRIHRERVQDGDASVEAALKMMFFFRFLPNMMIIVITQAFYSNLLAIFDSLDFMRMLRMFPRKSLNYMIVLVLMSRRTHVSETFI